MRSLSWRILLSVATLAAFFLLPETAGATAPNPAIDMGSAADMDVSGGHYWTAIPLAFSNGNGGTSVDHYVVTVTGSGGDFEVHSVSPTWTGSDCQNCGSVNGGIGNIYNHDDYGQAVTIPGTDVPSGAFGQPQSTFNPTNETVAQIGELAFFDQNVDGPPHVHVEAYGTQSLTLAAAGMACIADPSFVGPVTGCKIWEGPKNPFIGNEQQDWPLPDLTIDAYASDSGFGTTGGPTDPNFLGTFVTGTNTLAPWQFSLQMNVHVGEYVWWAPRAPGATNSAPVSYVNEDTSTASTSGINWDIRGGTYQSQTMGIHISAADAVAAAGNGGVVSYIGDFRLFQVDAAHWDWFGGSSSAPGTGGSNKDWLTSNPPNGFGGIGAGGFGASAMTGVGAIIPIWGESDGQKVKVPLYGSGTICWSSDGSTPSICQEVSGTPIGGDSGGGIISPIRQQNPVYIDNVGQGGIEVQSGSFIVGPLEVEGQTQVTCTQSGDPALGFDSNGCAIFGPAPTEPTTPVLGTLPSTLPSQPPVQRATSTAVCQLFALPSTFDLAGCLSIIFVPQRDLTARWQVFQAEMVTHEPIAGMTAGAVTLGKLWGFFGDDTMTVCVPMLGAQLAQQGVNTGDPCFTWDSDTAVLGWQIFQVTRAFATVAILCCWFWYARNKFLQLTAAAS